MSMRRVVSCRDAAWWWSSCSHCGVINAIRQATAVSGVSKLHAVLRGYHLGVAPSEYIEHTIAELKAMTPDVVIPMHCTGRPSRR